MEAQHPRNETDKQRFYWRKKLRDRAEAKIKRFSAMPMQYEDETGAVYNRGSGFRLVEGLYCDISKLWGTLYSESFDIVNVHIYQSEDALGPFTQYSSRQPGEFVRSEWDPRVAASTVESDSLPDNFNVEANDPATILAISGIAALSKLKNEAAGIDSHPISAYEARQVIERIKNARPEL